MIKYLILFPILIAIGLISDYLFTPCRDFHQARLGVGRTSINVALATTPSEQARGLMDCRSLPADSGMFFIFPQPQQTPFWMKNMLIPLDIIWIKNSQVLAIMESLPPAEAESQPPLYFPHAPYDSVLELPAGVAKRQSIKVGDSIILDTNS